MEIPIPFELLTSKEQRRAVIFELADFITRYPGLMTRIIGIAEKYGKEETAKLLDVALSTLQSAPQEEPGREGKP